MMMNKSSKPTKVLLVDDVRLFLELEKTFFRRQGCEILTATTGAEALTLVQNEQPDLVVLDLFLPELDGLGVLKWIRGHEETKDMKVIIVSVSGKEEDIQNCHQAGCDAYLTKPITQKILLDTAAQILRIPQRIDVRIWIEMHVEGYRGSEKLFGQSENISIGGIYVKSENEFPPGSLITLSFTLPDQEETLKIGSRLLRVEKLPPAEGKTVYGLAFQYVNLLANERRLISDYIRKINTGTS